MKVARPGGWSKVARFGTLDWPYAMAAGLSLAALLEVALRPGPAWPLQLLLALAGALPIALARVQPVAAAALILTAITITLIAFGQPPLAAAIALAIPMYLAARNRSRLVTPILLLVATLAVGLFLAGPLLPSGASVVATDPLAPDASAVAGTRSFGAALAVLATAAVWLGLIRRARFDAARRDASVRAAADTLLEHAARGERARIARELHDVVAHHISMIAVQAEAARLTTPGLPPEGAKRLVAIGDTARSALTEMRRLLGVLREDASDEPNRRPQPGLHQLNELIDEARSLAAASTRLIVHGPVAPLEPGIELTAYRIVQEALTNARRHAPGAAVDVELEYRRGEVNLRIRDNGPGPSGGPGGGHGLDGMRERATMVGGRLAAGAAPLGGFVVEAILPIPDGGPILNGGSIPDGGS